MKFRLIIDQDAPEEVVVTARGRSELTDRLEEMVLQYAGEDQLIGYTEDDMRMLHLHEIEMITVVDGKTWALDGQGEMLRLRQRLYEIEERLPAYFVRINKSSIVNEKHLVRFASGFSGAVDAVLRCGKKEYVSRRCFSQIKRRYSGK